MDNENCRQFIGITGGIGAGKSLVSRILRLKGFGVYDCDSRAKSLMDTDREILDSLFNRFGRDVVDPNLRSINRRALARIVFATEEERLWLNALVHKAVKDDIVNWGLESSLNIFVESAILCESHLTDICREVWLVDAPEDLRLSRALARNPEADSDDIRRRIEAQRSEQRELRKLPIPLYIIQNDGMKPILTEIDSLLAERKN
ncbi:MAG: dephospho-CoA kinase [Clostridium sp.]|nr:dephospho-CoA kinase [Prevotella sp.]MCM1428217.1 dephospho-CoA kinase [Clostridium sp.]MCM1475947.1 dephospho-CoA kinase [Muribaculaceae bacterium]